MEGLNKWKALVHMIVNLMKKRIIFTIKKSTHPPRCKQWKSS